MPAKKDEEVKDPKLIAAEIVELEAKAALHAAEAKAADAAAAKDKAEAAVFKADARIKAAQAEEEELEVQTFKEKWTEARAADTYHHLYNFDSQVSESSVKNCIKQLTTWMRLDPTTPVEIVFNSPGGDVIAGLALFDFIKKVRDEGTYVTTSSIGYAASMAGVLLQSGDWRVMGKTSWLMLHEASFGAGGKTSEVEDRVEWIKRVQDQFLDIFAERCASADPATATKRLSKTQIKRRWSRTDFWVPAKEALAFGLIDEIS